VLLVISLGIWFYFLLNSMKLANVKPNLNHAIPALLVILTYPIIISFFYFVSLLKELNGSEFRW